MNATRGGFRARDAPIYRTHSRSNFMFGVNAACRLRSKRSLGSQVLLVNIFWMLLTVTEPEARHDAVTDGKANLTLHLSTAGLTLVLRFHLHKCNTQ